MTRRHGIPVTRASQTIFDLRHVIPAAEVRRAIRQAEVLGLPLGEDVRHDRTRSDLEREADFVWRDLGFVVETDGYQYHRGRQAFDEDRRRDLELRSLGFDVQRLSGEQIDEEPERVAAILRAVLASRTHRVGLDGE